MTIYMDLAISAITDPLDEFLLLNENKPMFEIKHYVTDDGHDVFSDWRNTIKDSKAKIAIDRRIYRAELGNFGDHKPCREGVWELRINAGPGYRIYCALAEQTVVLLFCGGTKRSQDTDILKACNYWRNWRHSNRKHGDERSNT